MEQTIAHRIYGIYEALGPGAARVSRVGLRRSEGCELRTRDLFL